MEHQTQNRIDRILNRVHSLDDLSADDIVELRRVSERSIVIDKFKVSSAQYYDWADKVVDESIRGVEYDAQNACLVIKGGSGWMHEVATGAVYRVFYPIEDRLNAATGLRYFLTGNLGFLLAGKFSGSIKQADGSLKQSGAEYPVMVLEVGINETTWFFEDAQRWLEGTNGSTKLVIIVDIKETDCRNTSNDKWDLSEADFQQMTHHTLSTHILQWYRHRGIHLVGSFKISVHLWYSDGDRQCILNEAAFSPDNLIDLTTIENIPLRLGHLMPDGSDLDENERLYFPLKHLVHTLQRGFKDIEIDRADLLADEKKKY